MTREGEARGIEMALGEGLGGRPMFHELTKFSDRALRQLKADQNQSVMLLRPLTQGQHLDHAEIPGVFDAHQAAMVRNQTKLRRFLLVMEGLGMSRDDMYRSAKAVKYSTDSIDSAYGNYRISKKPNKQFYGKLTYNVSQAGEDVAADRVAAIEAVVNGRPDIIYLDND